MDDDNAIMILAAVLVILSNLSRLLKWKTGESD